MVSLFGEFGITADTSGVPALDLDALKAVETCDVDKMQLLLEGLGESETQRILSKGVDETGRQLLHVASSQGGEDAADMVRLLLEHGAPVNAADFIDETPLSLAIAVVTESDHSDSTWAALDTIRVLLVAGANNVSSLLLAELEGRSNEEELCNSADCCKHSDLEDLTHLKPHKTRNPQTWNSNAKKKPCHWKSLAPWVPKLY